MTLADLGRGGSTEIVAMESCMEAVDRMADFFDGREMMNRVV